MGLAMIENSKLRLVFQKTKGHCHFCGDSLIFSRYGVKDINKVDGCWEADHIIQKGKGGSADISNCLPCCVKCNRLRWHRKGNGLRELITLGLVAQDQIKKKTEIGKTFVKLKNRRLEANKKRRRCIK